MLTSECEIGTLVLILVLVPVPLLRDVLEGEFPYAGRAVLCVSDMPSNTRLTAPRWRAELAAPDHDPLDGTWDDADGGRTAVAAAIGGPVVGGAFSLSREDDRLKKLRHELVDWDSEGWAR